MRFIFWRKNVVKSSQYIKEQPHSYKTPLDRCMNCIRFTRDCTINLSNPPGECKLFYQLDSSDIAKYKVLRTENAGKPNISNVYCPGCGSLQIARTYSDRFECKKCGKVFS